MDGSLMGSDTPNLFQRIAAAENDLANLCTLSTANRISMLYGYVMENIETMKESTLSDITRCLSVEIGNSYCHESYKYLACELEFAILDEITRRDDEITTALEEYTLASCDDFEMDDILPKISTVQLPKSDDPFAEYVSMVHDLKEEFDDGLDYQLLPVSTKGVPKGYGEYKLGLKRLPPSLQIMEAPLFVAPQKDEFADMLAELKTEFDKGYGYSALLPYCRPVGCLKNISEYRF